MANLITFLNTTGKTFVDFSTPMLIQSSLLIVALLVLDLLLRKKVRAVFRHCIWMLVLVKLVLPTTLSSPTGLGYWFGDQLASIVSQKPLIAEQTAPILSSIESVSETALPETTITALPSASTAQEPIAGIPAVPAIASLPATVSLSWQGFAFLGWLAAVIAMALLLVQRMFFVRGLLAQSKEPSDSMIDTFQQCRKQMKIRGKVNLKLSPVAASPSVCGLLRPTILIPQNLPSKLNREDLRSILLHELAHIKRGDLPVSLIQTILQIAYFYNPLLWLANAIIRKVREQAVDEMVLVAMGERAEDYPETLLNISRLTFSRPALSLRLIGVVESKKALSGRIKHILSRPFPKTAKLGFLGLLAIILTASILLPMAKAASKPPKFVIKGTVTDAQTGQPIAGAKVGDVDRYAEGKQWTTTDSNGNYEYKTWYEEHGVKAEADGYKRQDKGFGTKLFGSEKEKIIDFELTPGKDAYQSEFKATLPNGVSVELIGVCELVNGEVQSWWQPNGEIIAAPVNLKSKPDYKDTTTGFLIRANMPIGSIKWDIEDANSHLGSIEIVDPNNEATKLYTRRQERLHVVSINDKASSNVGLKIAPKWEAKAKYDGKYVINGYDPKISFVEAYDTGEGVRVVFVNGYEKDGYESQLVAACYIQDENSKVRQRTRNVFGQLEKVHGTDGTKQTSALFQSRRAPVKLSDVKYFQLEIRRKPENVWFKNVSLKPNVKTDVQIEVEPPKTLPETKNSEYKQRYFVTIVAGSDGNKLGYKGQQITWEELEAKLRNLPNKEITVLEVAYEPGVIPKRRSDPSSYIPQWLESNEAFKRAGQLIKELGLEYLSFVGPDHPSTRRGPMSIRTEGKFNFDEEILVGLQSFEEKPLLNIRTVEFSKSYNPREKNRNNLNAKLKLVTITWPQKFWEVGVRLLDKQGNQIDSVVRTYDNKGVARGRPLRIADEMEFKFGQTDIEAVDRFEVKLREFEKPQTLAGQVDIVPMDFEITKRGFLQDDSIEITEVLGTGSKFEVGQTYTIKGKYKLSSHDQAMLHIYATNGETRSKQGPVVKRGTGEFTRTFTYVKEGWLHLSFYPADGGSSFGNLYFAEKGSNQQVPDMSGITSIAGEAKLPEQKLTGATMLQIIVQESTGEGKDEIENVIALSVPLASLKAGNMVLPKTAENQMNKYGITIEEIIKMIEDGTAPMSLLEVEEDTKGESGEILHIEIRISLR